MNRIITIGREFGSGGREMGVRLANELGLQYYDKEIITGIVNHTDYTESYVKEIIEGNTRRIIPVTIGRSLDVDVEYQIQQMQDIVKAQTEVIKEMAEKSDCVIVGRCAHFVLQDDPNVVRVFIHADYEDLIENAIKYDGCERDEAIRRIDRINKERAAYHKYYTDHEWNDARCYDLCLNTSKISIEKCIEVIEEYLKILDSVK